MKDFVVILDPAHGKDVFGKRSPDETHFEYIWSRYIIYKLMDELDKQNIDYIESNSSIYEIGLDRRVKTANEFLANYKLLISLHNNAAGNEGWTTANGVEVYTWVGQSESDIIAEKFLDLVKKEFPSFTVREDRTDGDGDKEARFTVLSGKYKAILIEWLFQDNINDLAKLKDDETNDKLVKLLMDLIIWVKYHLVNKND